MKKNLIELLSDKENVAVTGNKYVFPVKVQDEKGDFSHFSEEYSMLKLYQLTSKFNREKGFVNDEERYFTQLGTVKGIKALLRELANLEEGTIEGRLSLFECVESDIPEHFESKYFASGDRDRYKKKNPSTKEMLTKNGEQIYRFIDWVFNPEVKDVYVENDK
jgi:hypothetical protein